MVTLANLPAHDMLPRWIAVGVALAILAGGVFVAFSPGRTPARATLEAERARLMRELVAIEERRRAGSRRPATPNAARRSSPISSACWPSSTRPRRPGAAA